MKLVFGKTVAGDFTASEMTDKGASSFSYINMLKNLMNKGDLEIAFEEGVTEDEQGQINSIIDRIKTIAIPKEENKVEAVEKF